MYGTITMIIFWLSAAIPELLDATIMPMYGSEDKPVWWGFQWIITSIVGMVLSVFMIAHTHINECD